MEVDFRLYLITDRKMVRGPLAEAVRLALEGGVRAVQLREKDLPIRELLSLARELRGITREYGAKLFINDRVDVALLSEADGVHLGTQSMPAPAVRKLAGAGMLLGISTHSLQEAKAAESDGADFITFGPIFETPSKKRYGAPVGIDALMNLKKEIAIPIFAIGGVRSGAIDRIIAAGAYGISLISAVLGADDIAAAARTLTRELAEAGRGRP